MHIKNKTTKFLLLIAVLFFTGNLFMYGWIHGNHGEEAYEESQPEEGAATVSSSNMSIKELIMMGAGHFFMASIDINTVSNKYEMTEFEGFDSYGMYNATDSAINNLEMMVYYYGQLVSKADNTPYNQTVINKLMSLNYKSFREHNGLNKDIFDQVEGYLSIGDVRGAYKKIHDDVNNLLNRLYKIRWLIYWGYLPTSKAIMDLNQENMNCHYFGQYLTRVFDEIAKE